MKRTVQNTAKWLAACILLGIVSCKKYNGPDSPASPPNSPFSVITTGELYNPVSNFYNPYYWVNEQLHPLEMGAAMQAFPYGMEKVGNDLYIAGSYFNDARHQLPCYWKNGQKKDLPIDGLPVLEFYGARDVKWFNNTLYILGNMDFRPVIWKIKDNNITTIEIKPASDSVLDIVESMNLEVYNNQLYFGGTQDVERQNGDVFFEAGYWTVNTDDSYQYHVLESNLSFALGYGLTVSAKGVFITGERAKNTSSPDPAIWSLNGLLGIVAQVNTNTQQLNEVAVDSKGKLYLNVLDHGTNQPVVWKAGATSYEPLTPQLPASAQGFCNNLALKNDQLVYAYSYKINQLYYAGYTFNGKEVILKADSAQTIHLNRTGLFLE